MAHFGILCKGVASHVLSMGYVGQELVRRGHRVTLVATDEGVPVAKMLELPLFVLNSETVSHPTSSLARAAGFLRLARDEFMLRDYVRWEALDILELVPLALQELAVDGLVVDSTLPAGGTAADQVGVPFVTVHSAMFWNEEPGVPPAHTGWPFSTGRVAEWRNRLGYAGWHWFIQPTLSTINRHRRRFALAHLGRIDDAFSALAQISQLCPELDYPRRQLPEVFHYLGSLTSDRQVKTDHGFPWDRLDGRPLIFASLGTVADQDNLPVFPRILSACAGLGAQLVLALGKMSDDKEKEKVRERLGEIPADALVVDFAPQLALLDRASLLITHAGMNTVLEALGRGVPMLALPRGADQPAMAARVAYAGVGLVASFQHSTEAEIRVMVKRLLVEDSFRKRARLLQTPLRAAGGLKRAGEIAEEALTTRRPVRSRLTRASLPAAGLDVPMLEVTPQFAGEHERV